MRYLGYPEGLAISIEEVCRQLADGPDSAFGSRLVVERLSDGLAIGQSKLGTPDADGICEPDIKLDPTHWGRRYGTELWRALIDYAFRHSEARIVQGTPNRENVASVRMQMGAGMIKVGEGVFTEHLGSHPVTVPVPYVRLQITREDWALGTVAEREER